MATERKRMAQLRGLSNDWANVNPKLFNGEIGLEITPSGIFRMKIGDGVRNWVDLPYFTLSGDMLDLTSDQIVLGRKVFAALAIGTGLGTGQSIAMPTDVGLDGQTLMLDAANSRFIWGIPGSEASREILIPVDRADYLEYPTLSYVNIRVGTAEDPSVYFDIGMNTLLGTFTLYHRGADIIEPAPDDVTLMSGTTGGLDSMGLIWVNLYEGKLQIQNRSANPYTFVATSNVSVITIPEINADHVLYVDPINPSSVTNLKSVLDNLRTTGGVAPRVSILDDHVGSFDVRSLSGDMIRLTCERNPNFFIEMIVDGVDNTYYLRDYTQGLIQESNPRNINLQGTTGDPLSDGRIWLSVYNGSLQLQNRIGRTLVWKLKA